MMLETVASVVAGVGELAKTREVISAAPVAAGPGATATGFNNVLEQVAADAIGSMKAGEAASIQSMHGKLSAQKVVEAVMSAERSLQMAVAVRDKVVQAYQEISRMAI
jgi:flagellar hook-basal body complex protein FliE